MNKPYQRGFTLIELLVTIAIIAIIGAMATPSFMDMRTNQNLNRSVQELVTVLQEARSKATLERRDITVHLETKQKNALPSDTETTLNWMPSGTSKLTSSSTSLTYNLQGGTNSTNDTIFTICSDDTGSVSKTVTVSMMGTVQTITKGVC